MQATIRTLCLSTLLILAACSEQPPATEPQSNAAPSHYNTSLDMQALMALVVEPVADTLWSTAGWVLSDAGYEELYPTTDEGWNFAHTQSAMIVEIGNMLALPERVAERDNWLTYAQALSKVGETAMKATAEQNNEDYFQAGAQLYSVCTACHQAYNADIVSRFVAE
jgi:mono/diheme cytochrome c family protein